MSENEVMLSPDVADVAVCNHSSAPPSLSVKLKKVTFLTMAVVASLVVLAVGCDLLFPEGESPTRPAYQPDRLESQASSAALLLVEKIDAFAGYIENDTAATLTLVQFKKYVSPRCAACWCSGVPVLLLLLRHHCSEHNLHDASPQTTACRLICNLPATD